ncbi:MAG TPA: FAD-dependent oxidoreductase [Hyphomicrobiaceae bacterium]|nr:FAD-dependent oxidoreductase [Hyphomicrobiaceae bacterium]
MADRLDVLVIGGGFYGCEVALAFDRAGARRIAVIEREGGLLRRASYVNQARIHNGYHYPRSLLTARRSRENYVRFCNDYSFAVHRGMTKLYAIARDSRVDPNQFEHFCREIGAPYRPLGSNRARLFDTSLIEEAYEVEELAFDAAALARHLSARLGDKKIEVRTNTSAQVVRCGRDGVEVAVGTDRVEAGYVINCTYANLDGVGVSISTGLKRELAEIALIEPPRDLAGVGVTVMDGPFFSTMPFPAARCHSLTHVRYTPHEAWTETPATEIAPAKCNAVYMLRDASRYIPALLHARYVRSIFDIKAVLIDTEDSDGRPILFERHKPCPRLVSILGAKLDNIYDVLGLIEAESWDF